MRWSLRSLFAAPVAKHQWFEDECARIQRVIDDLREQNLIDRAEYIAWYGVDPCDPS